jgi:AmmeMemoRadiSam system protein A
LPGEVQQFELSEQLWMLRLARNAIESLARGWPLVVIESPPERLACNRACFVTLFSQGALRGCIGNVQPVHPLYRAVQENARAAASRDPRFPPVAAAELDDLKIEISVLTEPQPLVFDTAEALLSQLHPGVSGVVLQIGGSFGTFLPQVWRQIPDPTSFLDRLAEKAGFPADAWRGPGARVSTYRVQCFEE